MDASDISAKQGYHFAFAVDAKYVKYAGVLMTSILLKNIGKKLVFHFFCDGLNPEDKVRLDTFTALYKNTVIYIYDVHEHLENLKKSFNTETLAISRLNYTVFIRVMVPMLLSPDIERVLYLDADMLCVNDVDTLYNMNLEEYPLAAAMEGAYTLRSGQLKLSTDKYFNAGCQLINTAKWRELDLSYKVFAAFRENVGRYRLLEQDALNDVLQGNFKVIEKDVINLMGVFNPVDIELKPEKNVFWHFLNAGKPWFRYADGQIAEPYWKIVRQSLWNDMEALEPIDLVVSYLAGKNAAKKGEYKDAAYYLEKAADQLMYFYMENTRQGMFSEEMKAIKREKKQG